MLIQIVKQLMDGVARRALGIVVQDQPVARVLLDQLAWREVVLEIDDHRVSFLSEFRAAGRPRLAPECKPEWQPGGQPDGSLFLMRLARESGRTADLASALVTCRGGRGPWPGS